MFDRNANLTDDADRMVYGCDTFDGYNDHDPMYDDGPSSTYRCGRGPYRDIPCCVDDDGKFVGPGCKHCNPVDHEAQPRKWGFCRYENDAACYLRRSVSTSALLGLCREIDYTTACEWLGFDFRVERASERVWEKCCNECETHTEAVARYTRWANKVSKKL